MTYKLLDATRDELYGYTYFDIEIKDLVLRWWIIKGKIKFLFYCSKDIHLRNLIGRRITHQGIPEDLKNYIEDPFFEIELEKYINSGRF